MAATGGTLPARRAGATAATRVTVIPAVRLATAVLLVKTTSPAGREKPRASRSALRAVATPTPAARPMSEATIPTPIASTSTAASTWRRLAPTARRRPFSRVRWATVMKKVLKIMKPPTSRAMTAKTSMKVLKNDSAVWRASWFSCVRAAPVSTSMPPGTVAPMRRTSSSWETPGSAAAEMLSNLPFSPTYSWAAAEVNIMNDAPPGESAPPMVAMPTTVTWMGLPRTRTVACSPTA